MCEPRLGIVDPGQDQEPRVCACAVTPRTVTAKSVRRKGDLLEEAQDVVLGIEKLREGGLITFSSTARRRTTMRV